MFALDPTQFFNSKKALVDWSKEMLQNYDRAASKHVYDIVTFDESWIYAYEPESKQPSTVWLFQDDLNLNPRIICTSLFRSRIQLYISTLGNLIIKKRKFIGMLINSVII